MKRENGGRGIIEERRDGDKPTRGSADRAGYLLATSPGKSERSQERVTEQQQSCPNMRAPLLQCHLALFHLKKHGLW